MALSRKKKIGILTFHQATNPGAYLQCLALTEVLKSFGHEPEVINYINLKHLLDEYRGFLMVKKPMLLLGNIVKVAKFLRAQKKLPLSIKFFSNKEISKAHYDAIVIGSDIVWDFKNLAHGFDPLYFGKGLWADHLIAYAASFGSIDRNEPMPEEVKSGIRNFNSISVRDINSFEMVNQCGKDAQIVADPTFLWDFNGKEVAPPSSGYVLVYAFWISPQEMEQIKNFARARGLRTIAISYPQLWCDENKIALGPFEWLGYFKQARFVFTGTLHGTIFSIKYKKEFVTLPNKPINNKIEYFMRELDLNGRIWTEDKSLDSIVSTAIDYAKVGEKLKEFTSRSLKFLNDAIQS